MKYRKKPVVIEAFKYEGDFIDRYGKRIVPDWAFQSFLEGILFYGEEQSWELYVKTLEGNMHVNLDDYVIKGVKGEIYSCKPDIFEMTYEKLED